MLAVKAAPIAKPSAKLWIPSPIRIIIASGGKPRTQKYESLLLVAANLGHKNMKQANLGHKNTEVAKKAIVKKLGLWVKTEVFSLCIICLNLA